MFNNLKISTRLVGAFTVLLALSCWQNVGS